MHTARNRRASRQHVSKQHQPPPVARSARQEQDFMLRSAGTPPAFPRELILPGPHQAMNQSAASLEAENRAGEATALDAAAAPSARTAGPVIARRPKGKKARKAAMRIAAEQARKAASPKPMPAVAVSPTLEPAHASAPQAAPPQAPPSAPPAVEAETAICQFELVAGHDEALPAPADRAGPAAPAPVSQTTPQTHPETLPPAELSPALAPEPAPIFVLPSAPEPLVTALPLLAAALPLPRSRSLVPARRQGLVDVIAFLLRDSGRRLARWSAQRHKMREQYAQVYAADLRKAALQSQQEALEALRLQQLRR